MTRQNTYNSFNMIKYLISAVILLSLKNCNKISIYLQKQLRTRNLFHLKWLKSSEVIKGHLNFFGDITRFYITVYHQQIY